MKALKTIASKYFVAIDIETVRIAENFEDLSPEYQSAWEYKNKQAGVVPDVGELGEKWIKESALYAEFSKVCAVSLAFIDGTEQYLMCKSFYGEDEGQILTDLAEFLNKIHAKNRNYRLVGHASKYFDYPFLGKRYLINRMAIPAILDDSDKKPWETTNTCTNTLWKLGGTGAGSSLQALCTCAGIPISKVDMVGDQVGTEFYKGNYAGISDYCDKDTIATFNVIRFFKNEEIFQFEDVIYLDRDGVTQEEAPEVGPLQRLINTGEFDQQVKDGILNLVSEKAASEEELEDLRDIVLAHYQGIKSRKADREAREKEVNAFFESIKITA